MQVSFSGPVAEYSHHNLSGDVLYNKHNYPNEFLRNSKDFPEINHKKKPTLLSNLIKNIKKIVTTIKQKNTPVKK